MKRSSDRQLTLDIDPLDSEGSTSPFRSGEASWVGDDSPEPEALEFRGTSVERLARAASARAAGRINASKISESERNNLLEERHQLVQKKFETGLSRQEQNRLTYVDWSLDRIEDARHGLHLDAIESKIDMYERLGKELSALRSELERFMKKGKR
ncbi:hypothetical protein FQ775_17940 [Nitratireductor mangrovi]|uniref:Uncharacterized protein n=1 Tax=Nitratireductor mangrovi TaxID=2599600 RepID=A0A5B8L387_9HYPH|nr:hypothetical protein [Nitratireductor mangrovi]QDZ02110.1 hypothetical protein FQ775_17940 [Nitratireductor mangrovi]